MKTLADADLKGKIVLVRVDYNVPLEKDEEGRWAVASNLRIKASLPTIEYLRSHEAKKIILMSHLGRPDGKVDPDLSLGPVAEELALILGGAVDFVDQATGEEVSRAVEELPEQGILLLENLRFDPREEEDSLDFAKEIVAATGAEVFVQDGFAVVHRAHASTSAITKILPSYAGLLLEKEIDGLTRVMENPEKPFVVIIGGAKVDDKEPLIERFLPVADKILVGGKIAADGYQSSEKIYVAEDFDTDSEGNKLDIGPVATSEFIKVLETAKTVLWNGVLGKVEDMAFSTGSEIVAKYLGEHPEITSIICGGDTTGFIEGLAEKDPELSYSLVSTGGGAALELLCGNILPGVGALEG